MQTRYNILVGECIFWLFRKFADAQYTISQKGADAAQCVNGPSKVSTIMHQRIGHTASSFVLGLQRRHSRVLLTASSLVQAAKPLDVCKRW